MTKQESSFIDFRNKHKYFFWWIKDVSKIDSSAMLEATLTYGNMEERKELLSILGKPKFKEIFTELTQSRRAQNIEPRTLFYWKHYLSK